MTQQQPNCIRAQTVVEYLQQHPDFFAQHPDLLKLLSLKQPTGGAISLLERQNQMLRSDLSTLQRRLRSLLANAQRNDRLFAQLRQTILALINTQGVDALANTATAHLCQHFAIDQAQLLLIQQPPACAQPGWRATSRAQIDQHFPYILAQKSTLSGPLSAAQRQFLFDDPAIACVAVTPVGRRPIGLLALGSVDPQYFSHNMDALFLTHLADVIGELLAQTPVTAQEATVLCQGD